MITLFFLVYVNNIFTTKTFVQCTLQGFRSSLNKYNQHTHQDQTNHHPGPSFPSVGLSSLWLTIPDANITPIIYTFKTLE